MDKNLGQDTSWGLKIGGCVTYDELEDNQLHLLPWLHLSTQAYIVFDLYILKSLHLVPLSPGVPVGSVPTCPKKCFSPNSFQTHVFFVFLRGVSFLELFHLGPPSFAKGGPFSKK